MMSATSKPLKTVLITGYSPASISHSLVHSFHAADYHVFATSLHHVPALSLPNLTHLTLDVTSPSSITAALDAVSLATHGTLDVLVNNAGVGYTTPLLTASLPHARALFDVNVWGALSVTQSFAALLIAARGTIVNVSSIAGMAHGPWIGVYAGSKAAMSVMSETLRLEVETFGVRVVTAQAGAVRSGFWDDARIGGVVGIYEAAKGAVEFVGHGGSAMGREIEASVFAERLVRRVEEGGSGLWFCGGSAGLMRWMAMLMPRALLDMFLRSVHRSKRSSW